MPHRAQKRTYLFMRSALCVCYSFLYCVLLEVRIQFHRVNYNFWKGNKTIVSVVLLGVRGSEKYDIPALECEQCKVPFSVSVLAIWAIRYLHANGRSSQCDSTRSICTQHQMFDVEFMCVHHLVVLVRSRSILNDCHATAIAAAKKTKYQMSAASMWCLCAAKRFLYN